MKIRYKLILIFVFIILSASLPLSLFILNEQENDKISLLVHHGETNSRILARATVNILLMNGGDIITSRVDVGDMIANLKPLTSDGLVYADAILISSRKERNGIILGRYQDSVRKRSESKADDRISAAEVGRLKNQAGFTEFQSKTSGEEYYEFVSPGSIRKGSPVCVGRLIFSKAIILGPIKRLRFIIYLATGLAILPVSLFGVFFSRIISQPIVDLTEGLGRIELGHLDYRVPVKTRDEIGKLSTSFNHMLRLLDMQITELVNTNRELKRLDLLKDEFLANMSHELRSPIYGMIGLVQSLIEGAGGPIGKDAVHDLQLVEISGKRLSHLVNDILDFSKLKHHDIELHKVPVDMHSVAQLVMSLEQPLVSRKGLKIYNKVEPGSTIVMGDRNRLQQVMLNIVGNAVKFTEDGEIIISAELNEDKEYFTISVTDTGIGISPELYEKIFESFEQADGSTSRSYGGSGLGLSISQKLVELHEGRIWVESEEGRGSRFHFTLQKAEDDILVEDVEQGVPDVFTEPVNISADGIREFVSQKSPDRKRTYHVMVVDDEPVNLQVVINHLSLEGYHVETASSGPEMLALLKEGHVPDLVLLDVMLPRMSGYEVCRKIRESYSSHELPVLMLTAKNKPGDVVTGIEAGANDYITKPISREELLARVINLLSLKDSILLHNELNIIKRDLDIAHEIQQAMLIQDVPDCKNVDIAIRYKAMTELGGDFYDIQLIDDTKIAVLVADVSGHGIAAALICVMLKVAYSFHSDKMNDPSMLMKHINSTMYNYTHDQFITACFVYIDLEEMTLYQANGGHWPLLIWRETEKQLISAEDKNLPFGWMPDGEYTMTAIKVEKNDRIILYTDGIIEARSPGGKMYGDAKFHSLLEDKSKLDAESFVDTILNEVYSWMEIPPEHGLDDDVTLVVLDLFRGE